MKFLIRSASTGLAIAAMAAQIWATEATAEPQNGLSEVIVCPCTTTTTDGTASSVEETDSSGDSNEGDAIDTANGVNAGGMGECLDDDALFKPGNLLSLCLFTPQFSPGVLQTVDHVYLTDSMGNIEARQVVLDEAIGCEGGCIIETPIWLKFFGALEEQSLTPSGKGEDDSPGGGDDGGDDEPSKIVALTVNVVALVSDDPDDVASMHDAETTRIVSTSTMVLLDASSGGATVASDGQGQGTKSGGRTTKVFAYSTVFGVAVLLQTSVFLCRYNLLSRSQNKRKHTRAGHPEDDFDGLDLTPEEMAELGMECDPSEFLSSKSMRTRAPGSSMMASSMRSSSRAFASSSAFSTNSVDDTPRISNAARKSRRRVSLFQDSDDDECKQEIGESWDDVSL